MKPRSAGQRYAEMVSAGDIQADPAQIAALIPLDAMSEALRAAQHRPWWRRIAGRPVPVRGLYLWGRVGRGKTLLTELFLEDLGDVPHQRWHFHRFMNHVHQQLAGMPDTADTLAVLAARLARECRLLVLDEFFVSDIGDAMILHRLLDQLVQRQVSFIATSNVPPDELYLNGLQRDSFLPCIALLKRECVVMELESAQDYRLRTLNQARTYVPSAEAASRELLAQQYRRLSGRAPLAGFIEINRRDIPVQAISPGVAWFAFEALCEGPRSSADYIEIARDFHTVLLSDVPRFDAGNEDAARRFVYLIDELYDRHVNLLLSAAADPLMLYSGDRLRREFERTASRLIEMQSEEYLAREHRP
ncbi:cell division protein ZapE [Arenimonas sp. GDDSR-1]|uniref:cell division protein ZapE n=1 Tax=Arenimonas sp. GDDSR-1 TaxID=2950125 RepID=UPI00260BBCE2|nr:cell division protein ZapE [Arenimonas sp. GDDSR-1]